ncbi:lipocalin family protein [Uliginosibacterium sediminicola]|uniref:Outer membrane lipoprotein Blc n=1 Tax=Uliginosibacterium sediminicola TaxID=2024550 RepID=A0ABU9YZA2_9RHOO
MIANTHSVPRRLAARLASFLGGRSRSLALLLCLIAQAPAQALDAPPTVSNLDLQRYLGTWYEIAAYPQSFQRGCVASRADYSLRSDGTLDVLNRCRKERLDGEWKEARGNARVVGPGKLKVSFFWPFEGDYWVLALDADYRWVLVGGPNYDYLWILSRTPQLDAATYSAITTRAAALGYPLSPLQKTLQAKD